MNTSIYFVRHAISPFSLDNERLRGLSEQGKSDAKKVADILAGEGIEVIASSTFARAIDTVQPLADRLGLEVILFEELIERPIASLKVEIPEEDLIQAIEKSFSEIDFCLPEGETTRTAQKRAIPVIVRLLNEYAGKKIAIGTHGNIMTIILQYFDPKYGFDFWQKTSKPDIYKLEFDGLQLIKVDRLWEQS